MVVLRFASEGVRRACCDPARMRERWGPAVARQISRRLQQLEAMETIADLVFLPFDSHDHGGGVIEVVVADQVSLFVERGTDAPQGGSRVNTITVTAIRARSTVARAS
jgi:hypothetical protein